MIFVTVGAQMPFDRLVKAVDEWAGRSGRSDVFAQIGTSDYQPKNMQWERVLSAQAFRERYAAARAIVAHAGTGSLITALQLGKPILVMPRRADLRETRNDHQIATAERFRNYRSVLVARDESELVARLPQIDLLDGVAALGAHASRELLAAIRGFIEGLEVQEAPDADDAELVR